LVVLTTGGAALVGAAANRPAASSAISTVTNRRTGLLDTATPFIRRALCPCGSLVLDLANQDWLPHGDEPHGNKELKG
jgi:hypothetical protein